MAKLRYVIFFLILFGFSAVGYAEFYRYKDEKGVIRYTDDLAQVPPAQREQAEEYPSVVTPEPKKGVPAEGAGIATEQKVEEDEIDVPEGRDLAQLEKLNKKKASLDKEYADLVKEKDDLVKSKEGIKKDSELKAYNEKIVDLNERISVFEKKRQEFAKEVDVFNARFKQ